MKTFANRIHRMISTTTAAAVMMIAAEMANAASANTNASATGNVRGPGTATATAGYTGDQGFAQTNTRSGNVNFASGVALGVDSRGVSFSASNAVAGRFGAAIAGNLNITIGTDGSVATSGGMSTARGGLVRTVSAGGFAENDRGGSIAASTAGARTDPRGESTARTWSKSTRRHGWRR